MVRRILCLFAVVVSFVSWQTASGQCYISYGATEGAKPNKLYLYFPAVSDSTFPSYYPNASPAKPFNVADLDAGLGTTAQLAGAINDVVVADYCEFNVQVLQTTTAPDLIPSPPSRRLTVAIGSDRDAGLYGVAREVDTGDALVVDYARVFGGTYADVAGGAGGLLNGTSSTLLRWARAIGGTAAHEAGHTYGLAHSAVVRSGEDAFNRHIMPSGPTVTPADRIEYRRHFSDEDFGILAANVGLSVQTVHNWDYTNPNALAASQLRMEVYSEMPSLTIGWSYGGLRSPWIAPVVTALSGPATFKGTIYNRFNVTWSAGQTWSNNETAPFEPSGVVGAGKNFHVGAEFVGVDFNASDPVIIHSVTLLDASGAPLPLHPRMVAYDAGALDARDGRFRVRFFNVDGGPPLLIKEFQVRQLPRVLSIESMLPGKPMLSWDQQPVRPWKVRQVPDFLVSDETPVLIASLSEGHNVFINYSANYGYQETKPTPDSPFFPEVNELAFGYATDLFPSTTVYVTATVVDPDAEHWDESEGRIVRGPVESKLFYQFKGIRPDLNHNRIDDLVDIANGTSKDTNHNGVPDEVDPNITQRCGAISLSPRSSTFAIGTVGVPYFQLFTAAGGVPPYRFEVSYPQTIPPGLTLSSAGLLSGAPTLRGRFNFGVKATDSAGASACSQVYSITVAP